MQLLLQEAINFAKTNSTHIELKEEQKEAVRNIVNGRDVIAVLPTGFGKSLIYQLLPSMFGAFSMYAQPKYASTSFCLP